MTADNALTEQLSRIVRLMTILVTRDLPQKEQIVLLDSAGFQPKEIAQLIGTTPNTVSVTLSAMRRARGEAKGKARSRAKND